MARAAEQEECAAAAIRVLIVDDSDVYSRSLSATLAGYPEVEVAGRTRTLGGGLELARAIRPDVVLLDLSLIEDPGLEVALELRRVVPVGIVVLSSYDSEAIQQLVREACVGFVSKQRAASDLLPAIHRQDRWAHAESAARLRQLAETIDEVFWLTNVAKDRIIYVSPAYERIWGRSCESLYHAPRSWLDAIHEDDRERVKRAALELQAKGSYDVDYRIVRPDGSIRWIHDRAYPVVDRDGAVRRITGAAADVTDRRQAEERLEQALMLESAGRLAARLAHDLRNLLTVVDFNARLAARDASIAADARQCLSDLLEASAKAATLVQQFVSFSARHGAPRPFQALDLAGATDRLLGMFRGILGDGIRIDCHAEPELPQVQAEPSAIDQLVMNLVVNARDALSPRGGHITVRVYSRSALEPSRGGEAGRATGWVVLSVADDGIGIQPEHLERIFEPFFTTKAPGTGTGLGLATVREVVRRHRGWVEVDSKPDAGTTFRVFLPALE